MLGWHEHGTRESESWTLKSTFEIPAGARYVNSGFYLVHADPTTPLATLDARERAAFEAALDKARDRRSRFGEGPFELDFFSHEMQIIAGTDGSVPVENRGPGAFYGIDVGNGKGLQSIPNPYELFQGTTYELTLVNEGLNRKTYLRAVGFQADAILVSEYTNLSRDEDPVRGGAPTRLLLQAFYNNGQDVNLPVFKSITLDER